MTRSALSRAEERDDRDALRRAWRNRVEADRTLRLMERWYREGCSTAGYRENDTWHARRTLAAEAEALR